MKTLFSFFNIGIIIVTWKLFDQKLKMIIRRLRERSDGSNNVVCIFNNIRLLNHLDDNLLQKIFVLWNNSFFFCLARRKGKIREIRFYETKSTQNVNHCVLVYCRIIQIPVSSKSCSWQKSSSILFIFNVIFKNSASFPSNQIRLSQYKTAKR